MKRWIAIGIGAAACPLPSTAHAWLFEEHADIGRAALESLYGPDAATLDRLWRAARLADAASTSHLCVGPSDPGALASSPNRCVDFGALAATSGDHSCTPWEMWSTVTQVHSGDVDYRWFADVYASAAVTALQIANATQKDSCGRVTVSTTAIVDAWHESNITLTFVDPKYVSRAAHNDVHFLLGRSGDRNIREYVRHAATPGVPMNDTVAYALFHLAALDTASRLPASPNDPAYPPLARVVLSSEAFALHFLQDSFAAGHLVGFDGHAETTSERAGTHDYYCQYGLEARLWHPDAEPYIAHGDAFQTNDDRWEAGIAVQHSLAQVLQVAGGDPIDRQAVPSGTSDLAGLDVCKPPTVTEGMSEAVLRATSLLEDVLSFTPQPYSEIAPLPHFRNEFGLELLGTGAARFAVALGGHYDPNVSQAAPRFQSALSVGVGVGISAAGLTTAASEGAVRLYAEAIGYLPEQYPGGVCDFQATNGCLTAPLRFGWGIRAGLPALPVTMTGARRSLFDEFEEVHRDVPVSWQIVIAREVAFYISKESYFRMTEVELPVLAFQTPHLFSQRVEGGISLQLGGELEQVTLTGTADSDGARWAGAAFARLAFGEGYFLVP
jgi:hypothetical protein